MEGRAKPRQVVRLSNYRLAAPAKRFSDLVYHVGQKTILIVDDDPAILNMLAQSLELDYDVLLAGDGVAAAYLYERNIEKIAAIVTDLEMRALTDKV